MSIPVVDLFFCSKECNTALVSKKKMNLIYKQQLLSIEVVN